MYDAMCAGSRECWGRVPHEGRVHAQAHDIPRRYVQCAPCIDMSNHPLPQTLGALAPTNHLWVAGGIGITPLYSMLRHVWEMETMEDGAQTSPRRLLLYSAKNVGDFVLHSEISEMVEGSDQDRLQVRFRVPGSGFHRWHASNNSRMPDLQALPFTLLCLCCPPGMGCSYRTQRCGCPAREVGSSTTSVEQRPHSKHY